MEQSVQSFSYGNCIIRRSTSKCPFLATCAFFSCIIIDKIRFGILVFQNLDISFTICNEGCYTKLIRTKRRNVETKSVRFSKLSPEQEYQVVWRNVIFCVCVYKFIASLFEDAVSLEKNTTFCSSLIGISLGCVCLIKFYKLYIGLYFSTVLLFCNSLSTR